MTEFAVAIVPTPTFAKYVRKANPATVLSKPTPCVPNVQLASLKPAAVQVVPSAFDVGTNARAAAFAATSCVVTTF